MELEFRLPSRTEKDNGRNYDFIVIGAGAAGLSAAIYAARSGMQVCVLDRSVGGGLTTEAPLVENYLGFNSVSGAQLSEKFVRHASQYCTIRENTIVSSISRANGSFIIGTSGGPYTAKAVGIASGTGHKKLGIPGEMEYGGKGISYCSTCDGYFYRGKDVVVIGGGNSGAIAAISMSEYARSVSILARRPDYMCEDAYVSEIRKRGIDYILNSEATAIRGDGAVVKTVEFRDRTTGEYSEIQADGVFIYAGLVPATSFLSGSGVRLSESGHVVTDVRGRTSVRGIYAAGDVTEGSESQIATAVGEGCRMAITAYNDMLSSGRELTGISTQL